MARVQMERFWPTAEEIESKWSDVLEEEDPEKTYIGPNISWPKLGKALLSTLGLLDTTGGIADPGGGIVGIIPSVGKWRTPTSRLIWGPKEDVARKLTEKAEEFTSKALRVAKPTEKTRVIAEAPDVIPWLAGSTERFGQAIGGQAYPGKNLIKLFDPDALEHEMSHILYARDPALYTLAGSFMQDVPLAAFEKLKSGLYPMNPRYYPDELISGLIDLSVAKDKGGMSAWLASQMGPRKVQEASAKLNFVLRHPELGVKDIVDMFNIPLSNASKMNLFREEVGLAPRARFTESPIDIFQSEAQKVIRGSKRGPSRTSGKPMVRPTEPRTEGPGKWRPTKETPTGTLYEDPALLKERQKRLQDLEDLLMGE